MSDDATAPRNPDLRLPGHLLDRRVGADVEQVGHEAVGVGANLTLHQEQGAPGNENEGDNDIPGSILGITKVFFRGHFNVPQIKQSHYLDQRTEAL